MTAIKLWWSGPSRLCPSRLCPSRLCPSRLCPSRLCPSRLCPSWLWMGLLLGGLLGACQSKKADPTAGTAAAPVAALMGPIKIGLIAPFSGPFAGAGKQIEGGVRAYLEVHGSKVSGREIELLVKDVTGVAPDVAKSLAQGLIVRDNVDFLAGFVLTPNALAV